MYALELSEFFGKLAVSQKLEEISKCCQKDFLKNISLKAQFHILTISRTVHERVNFKINGGYTFPPVRVILLMISAKTTY